MENGSVFPYFRNSVEYWAPTNKEQNLYNPRGKKPNCGNTQTPKNPDCWFKCQIRVFPGDLRIVQGFYEV